MITIPATEAKNRFGELLDTAGREPVGIAKNGRAVAVVLSAKTYADMQLRIENPARPTRFSSLASWRKSQKTRITDKPMDEADYQQHLDQKYAR